eukprot:TRINITY_DN26942_c0_g1_i1.p1 TRINITY_DN26942_c0_g1~~TRINITY_DN26942_c0_g1_i1.p1  ORF type:complete len:238 (+),score=50.94 TRINITY_DN26942_c0_g1_i1:64-777(+)
MPGAQLLCVRKGRERVFLPYEPYYGYELAWEEQKGTLAGFTPRQNQKPIRRPRSAAAGMVKRSLPELAARRAALAQKEMELKRRENEVDVRESYVQLRESKLRRQLARAQAFSTDESFASTATTPRHVEAVEVHSQTIETWKAELSRARTGKVQDEDDATLRQDVLEGVAAVEDAAYTAKLLAATSQAQLLDAVVSAANPPSAEQGVTIVSSSSAVSFTHEVAAESGDLMIGINVDP